MPKYKTFRDRWLRGDFDKKDQSKNKNKDLKEFGKMELKLATIKCEKCGEEGYIENWRVGLKEGELIRVCPSCNHEQIIN